MMFRCQILICVLTAFVVVGCAKTEITDREKTVTGKLPRPTTFWVYDFAATPEDLPLHTSLDKKYFTEMTPQTDEQIAKGRKLGAEIQTELVSQLHNMGFSAKQANAGTTQKLHDIIIQGYILSFDEGDAKKRVAIGFGKGASQLKIAVEGLQVTSEGLRVLGSGTMEAGAEKTPGGAAGLAVLAATKNPAGLIVSTGMHVYGEKTGSSKVEGRAKQAAEEIAEILKERFKEQGWM